MKTKLIFFMILALSMTGISFTQPVLEWERDLPNSLRDAGNSVWFIDMKKDIHPKAYQQVVFKDMSNGYSFLSRSTASSKETVKWEDGNEYPLIKLEISNTSHPFYTGKNMLVDTAGRIDKFRKRYEKKK